ncbi:MAG TPA: hypothetical protein VEW03_03475 [Longimicrobiaceae bacterium]|nr:hypothetical protein [Longimicrobiaceae bacterium]
MDLIKVTDPNGNVAKYVGSFDRPTNTVSKFGGGSVYLSERDRIETEPLEAIILVVVVFIILALLM